MLSVSGIHGPGRYIWTDPVRISLISFPHLLMITMRLTQMTIQQDQEQIIKVRAPPTLSGPPSVFPGRVRFHIENGGRWNPKKARIKSQDRKNIEMLVVASYNRSDWTYGWISILEGFSIYVNSELEETLDNGMTLCKLLSPRWQKWVLRYFWKLILSTFSVTIFERVGSKWL